MSFINTDRILNGLFFGLIAGGAALLGFIAHAVLGLENWLLWALVNAVSITLYAYKGLYPTVGLYAVLFFMSFVGYGAWRARAAA